jgi:hypothetical protein
VLALAPKVSTVIVWFLTDGEETVYLTDANAPERIPSNPSVCSYHSHCTDCHYYHLTALIANTTLIVLLVTTITLIALIAHSTASLYSTCTALIITLSLHSCHYYSFHSTANHSMQRITITYHCIVSLVYSLHCIIGLCSLHVTAKQD